MLSREVIALKRWFVNEAAEILKPSGGKIQSLASLEQYLTGKTLPGVIPKEKKRAFGLNLAADITFLPSDKNPTVPQANHMRIAVLEGDTSVTVSSEITSRKAEEAIKDFDKIPNPSFKSMWDIAALCDTESIYNFYRGRSMNLLRDRSPVVYRMLFNCEQKKVKNKTFTLAVWYDERQGKFNFGYNPDFVLVAALEEWAAHPSDFSSFEGCYIYTLAFLFGHEMLHLVHHNTTSTVQVTDAYGHEMSNIIQDSFINCKLPDILDGSYVLAKDVRAKPLVSGIGSSVSIRSEHNVGLKKLHKADDIDKAVGELYLGYTRSQKELRIKTGNNYDMEAYEGLDFVMEVEVSPESSIRVNSGMIQKFLDDFSGLLSDGRLFYSKHGLTQKEVESGLDPIPVGSLVKVRSSGNIYIVKSVDKNMYTLNSVRKEPDLVEEQEDGSKIHTPVYSDSGTTKGKKRRANIEIYVPEPWVEGTAVPKKDALSEEDIESVAQPDPPQDGQTPPPPNTPDQKEPVKVLAVDSIVWIPKKKKFGKVVSIIDGKAHIVEVQEKPCILLDKQEVAISEGAIFEAPKVTVALKRRVFAETGNTLGDFDPRELVPIEMEFTDTDKPQSSSGGASSPPKKDRPPEPVDDNPLAKKEDSESDSGGGPGRGQQGEEFNDDEPDGSGAYGDSGDFDGDEDDEEGSDGDGGQDGQGSLGGSSGGQSSGDSGDSGDGQSGQGGQQGGEGQTGDGSDSSGSQSGGPGSESGDTGGGAGGEGGEDGDGFKDDDPNIDGDADPEAILGLHSESELAKAIEDLKNSTPSAGQMTENRYAEDSKKAAQEAPQNPGAKGARAAEKEKKALKDLLGKAASDAKKDSASGGTGSSGSASGDMNGQGGQTFSKSTAVEQELLKGVGAASITTSVQQAIVADWRRKLDSIIDHALGMDIVIDPNRINKRIPDAPPGVEDIVNDIKNIAVLIDCSGSMGAGQFVQVISHMSTMFSVRKMNKVNFHILAWGDSNENEISQHYYKVKGPKRFMETIMSKCRFAHWGTDLNPALHVIAKKSKKFDAILLLTDAEIYTDPDKFATEFFRKFKKRIIWTLPDKHDKRGLKKFDPTALAQGRAVIFHKGRSAE